MNQDQVPSPKIRRTGREWFVLFLVALVCGGLLGALLYLGYEKTDGTERDRLQVRVSRELSAIYPPWRESMWPYVTVYGLVFVVAGLGLFWRQRQRYVSGRLTAEQDKERLKLALDGAELGLWDRNFVTNVRTYSERWCTMLGYAPGAIDGPGTTWQELVHPDDLPTAREALGKHIRGETPFFESEHRMRHKDGRWIWILARGKVVERDAAGMPVRMAGTHMDITARKQADALLRDSALHYRDVFENNPQSMMIFDADTLSLLDVNEAAVAQYGYPKSEFLSLTMEDILAPEERRRFYDNHPRSSESGLKSAGVWQHRTRDGTVMDVEITSRERVFEGKAARLLLSQDITVRKKAEEALRDSESRLRSLIDLSSDWYWDINENFRFSRFDGYREDKIGSTSEQTLGKTRWEMGALNMTQADWEAHRALLETHQTFHDFELHRIDPKGVTYWISISGVPVFDEKGVFRGYRGIGRDITGRKRAEDDTLRLAFYDTLTGLPNRRLLLDRLSQAMSASARSHRHGALLYIDLDNFKDLNDTLGHDMGDRLLEQVGNRLVTCIRDGDTVARLGGDEFVVMLENLNDSAPDAAIQTEIVGEKLLTALNQPYDLAGTEHHSTPSIGVTLFSGHLQSVEELLKQADLAMYQAKAAGRNNLCLFDPVMQSAVAARATLEVDLRQGLKRQELLLYYQPVVDRARRVTGAEALVRWLHPTRGLVSPGEFIALAEQTGLILHIGQWVLQTACRQLAAWAAHLSTRHLTLAVNVSARQFKEADFVALVLAALDDSGANPKLLQLELTESMLLNDVEDIIAKMSLLKLRGVGFSLDDFGTGYSSLAYLKRLPLDRLKIDQSFVRDVLTDPNDAAIAVTILALARSLDLAVVAEGVETEGQRDFLMRNDCAGFQGYLFGRPGPADKLKSFPS